MQITSYSRSSRGMLSQNYAIIPLFKHQIIMIRRNRRLCNEKRERSRKLQLWNSTSFNLLNIIAIIAFHVQKMHSKLPLTAFFTIQPKIKSTTTDEVWFFGNIPFISDGKILYFCHVDWIFIKQYQIDN